MSRRTALIALAAGWLLACGPVPGGRLEGSAAPVPTEWTSALGAERAFCEIESRPADPHSIQLDCFVSDGRLYVQSHRWVFASWWPTESWAGIWIEAPDVRVRVGSAIFDLRAVHVTDPGERGPILRARGYDPIPEGIALFRFDPRS